jgi:hypothetical protein
MKSFKPPIQKPTKEGRINVSVFLRLDEWEEFRDYFKSKNELVYRHLEEALRQYLRKAKKELNP